MHVDEDFTDPTVRVFAGPQVDLVAADGGLLSVAFTAIWKAAAFGDVTLNDAFTNRSRFGCQRCFGEFGCDLVRIVNVINQRGRQRLRQFGAIAVQRICLQAQAP